MRPLVVDDERRDGGNRVRVVDEAARRALDLPSVMRELSAAAGAEAPACEGTHAGTVLPCLPGTSPPP